MLIYSALAFSLSALLTAIFAIKVPSSSSSVQSGLIWLILLFAALNAISRLFIEERERQTLALLQLQASVQAIYWGKLLFNFCSLLVFSLPVFGLYLFMVKVPVQAPLALLFLVILSNLALAAATTLLASIVAESDRKASIFAVISVPILFPALLIAVELTKKCLFAEPSPILLNDFTPLIGFTGAMLVAGGLLIENLWN